MKTLVDTSIWIEFFRERPALPPAALEALAELIRDDDVVTVEAIRAEVLSGRLQPRRAAEVRAAFDALRTVDLDWSARGTWDELVAMAGAAHAARLPVPGLVDRMILASGRAAGARLWTLDPPLRRLASHLGVSLA